MKKRRSDRYGVETALALEFWAVFHLAILSDKLMYLGYLLYSTWDKLLHL